MHKGLESLSERERETLRLLLGGHDAKSIATLLGLSVHTINERLRDARRKLAVSSSREAARILGEAERHAPQSVRDKDFGVSAPGSAGASPAATVAPSPAPNRLLWLTGGMFIMLIVIAIALGLVAGNAGLFTAQPAAQPPVAARDGTLGAADPATLPAAQAWLKLVDTARWQESWAKAAPSFRSAITAAGWEAQVKPVHAALGKAGKRSVIETTATTSLPDAPPGLYAILKFRTDFANHKGATETVIMTNEEGRWGVVGYYVR